jgi:hypothetical protein
MVSPARIERATYALGGRRAIQLCHGDIIYKTIVTIQLTSDLPDSGVKSAHIHLYIARFILVLEQIRGNLNSYQ